MIVADESHQGAVHRQITTIGLDIAKNGVRFTGSTRPRRSWFGRSNSGAARCWRFFEALPPCLVGMEACATAHYWARELTKLGHRVRLMPAKDVKAYVKRNKNRCCRCRGNLRGGTAADHAFVQVKSAEQQSQLMLHRTRDLLMRQRNAGDQCVAGAHGRAGIAAAQGKAGLTELLAIIAGSADERLPTEAHASLIVLAAELQAMRTLIA